MKLPVKSLAVSSILGLCWASTIFASPGEKQAESTGKSKPASGKPPSGSGEVKPANAKNKPAKKLPPTATAAVVNGQKITVGEVDKALDQMTRRQQPMPGGGPVPDRSKMQHNVLKQLIAERLLLQEAAEKKIVTDSKEVDGELAKILGKTHTEAEFSAELKKSGLTIQDVKKDIQTQLTIRRLIDQEIMPKVKVEDTSISDFYGKNPQYFNYPDQVHARHILVLVKQDAKDEEKKAAETKINDLLARVEKGEDFAQLAKDNSDDPGSKGTGGDLGFFPKGKMMKEFEEAAFSLEPGKVSKIVKTDYGFHLIKCEEVKKAGVTPLEEVKDKIKMYLTDQGVISLMDEHIKTLESNGKVKVYLEG